MINLQAWWARTHILWNHDYQKDDEGSWDWAPLSCRLGRNHDCGMFVIDLAVLGVMCRIAFEVDLDEEARWTEQRRQSIQGAHREMVERFKSTIQAAISDVAPQGATRVYHMTSAGPELVLATDEDEDDEDEEELPRRKPS